ncbi:MAG: NifB/NifX family molybdenum-iron cluster-binding protein [Syntrophobacteraceae bacterium]
MDEEKAMLAIPVFRSRVAPVLDWCSKIIIIPDKGSDAESGREIDVVKENMFRLMRSMREQGITTLICGALSPEILNHGESIGLRIIHGIAGDIEEVLQAYHERKLDQPKYWLPGCRGQRRYKGGARCSGRGKDGITSGGELGGSGTGSGRKGPGNLQWDKAAGGPGGFCVCPKCGSRKRHERGIPCSQVLCPACRSSMTRG